MKIDVSKFKHVKDTLISFIKDNPQNSLESNIALVSSFTHVPLIALYHISIKYVSNSNSLIDSLDDIIKFYGYTKIEGIDEL